MNGIYPIAIFGFGRSGTTWISDIISKYTGQIILFEPFHPAVFSKAQAYCYLPISPDQEVRDLEDHLKILKEKRKRNRWLLRNHLNSPLDDVSTDFADYLWNHTDVGGFKSIRMNHALGWFIKHYTPYPVFIMRHPLAVISSIIQRKQFWEEFGWSFHWLTFIQRSEKALSSPITAKSLSTDLVHREEQIALMWGISHIIALENLERHGLPVFYYEDFYQNPFDKAKELFDYLNLTEKSIHPSYLFTPSMLTLKTIHPYSNREDLADFPTNFWSKHLSGEQVKRINIVLHTLSNLDNRLGRILQEKAYI